MNRITNKKTNKLYVSQDCMQAVPNLNLIQLNSISYIIKSIQNYFELKEIFLPNGRQMSVVDINEEIRNINWAEKDLNYFLQYFPLDQNAELRISASIQDLGFTHHAGRGFKLLQAICGIHAYSKQDNKLTFEVLIRKTIFNETTKEFEFYIPVGGLRWFLYAKSYKELMNFDQKGLLACKTTYAKRIYLLLARHYKERFFELPIEEFREIMGVPKTFAWDNVVQKILVPVSEELAKTFECRLCFLWKPQRGVSHTRGRKPVTHVQFQIFDKEPNILQTAKDMAKFAGLDRGEGGDWYKAKEVFNSLCHSKPRK